MFYYQLFVTEVRPHILVLISRFLSVLCPPGCLQLTEPKMVWRVRTNEEMPLVKCSTLEMVVPEHMVPA